VHFRTGGLPAQLRKSNNPPHFDAHTLTVTGNNQRGDNQKEPINYKWGESGSNLCCLNRWSNWTRVSPAEVSDWSGSRSRGSSAASGRFCSLTVCVVWLESISMQYCKFTGRQEHLSSPSRRDSASSAESGTRQYLLHLLFATVVFNRQCTVFVIVEIV